ncbi:hypothetical protein GGS21DRAFT_488791 [Xylaria nigripes]|nr:hypothetical protein GGS21DRAFT_488791 [Xylaria nigripes]
MFNPHHRGMECNPYAYDTPTAVASNGQAVFHNALRQNALAPRAQGPTAPPPRSSRPNVAYTASSRAPPVGHGRNDRDFGTPSYASGPSYYRPRAQHPRFEQDRQRTEIFSSQRSRSAAAPNLVESDSDFGLGDYGSRRFITNPSQYSYPIGFLIDFSPLVSHVLYRRRDRVLADLKKDAGSSSGSSSITSLSSDTLSGCYSDNDSQISPENDDDMLDDDEDEDDGDESDAEDETNRSWINDSSDGVIDISLGRPNSNHRNSAGVDVANSLRICPRTGRFRLGRQWQVPSSSKDAQSRAGPKVGLAAVWSQHEVDIRAPPRIADIDAGPPEESDLEARFQGIRLEEPDAYGQYHTSRNFGAVSVPTHGQSGNLSGSAASWDEQEGDGEEDDGFVVIREEPVSVNLMMSGAR